VGGITPLKFAALRTNNAVEIEAPADVILGLAVDVERWPALLNHYRYVTQLSDSDGNPRGERVVKMAASRLRIPVSWTARQKCDVNAQEVRYEHIGGVTLGMQVRWHVQEVDGTALVTIDHTLRSPRWWLRNPVSSFILGRVFVRPIADMTLRGIKAHAESTAGPKS
jgi:uncharacterized membrane protein